MGKGNRLGLDTSMIEALNKAKSQETKKTPVQEYSEGIVKKVQDKTSKDTMNPSLKIDADLYIKFKIWSLSNNIEISDFYENVIDRALNNEIQLPIPKVVLKEQINPQTKGFLINKNKYMKVKLWLTRNNITLKDLLIFEIKRVVNEAEQRGGL